VEVIVTHANTDFDAFAAMIAARRLYPGALVALSGSLNRNVRDFYRLHAEELDIAEQGRVALPRVWVTTSASPATEMSRSCSSTTTERSLSTGFRARTSFALTTAR
jgi:nanoRNase/pAp phosphatase (c-di-AMP/oligoRNAs hydrolase)